MIDYTWSAIEKVRADLKKTFFALNIFLQLLYIAYLVYAIAASVGNLIANIILAAISVVYMIFYIFLRKKIKWRERQAARRAYSWSKLVVTAFTAGVAVYGVSATAQNVTVPAVILVSLMVISWVLRFVLEAFICFFEIETNLILEGMRTDIENAVKPFKTVGNTIKRLVGDEIEPEPEPNRYRKILDKRVAEKRSQRHERAKERIKNLFTFGKDNNIVEKEEEKKKEESLK